MSDGNDRASSVLRMRIYLAGIAGVVLRHGDHLSGMLNAIELADDAMIVNAYRIALQGKDSGKVYVNSAADALNYILTKTTDERLKLYGNYLLNDLDERAERRHNDKK